MKDPKSYFDAAKARRKKELTDRLRDLGNQIDQAKNRKEYFTLRELQKDFLEIKKELDNVCNNNG